MNPHKIIVRAPNWIGDAVLAVPALKAVRERSPDSEITLLVRPWVEGLFRSAPFVDTVWSRPSPGALRWIATAREIRHRRFDLAILLTNSFESALTVFAAGVPRRAGYLTDRRGPLLNAAIPLPGTRIHQTQYYLQLIEACLGGGPEPGIDMHVTHTGLASAVQLLDGHGIDTRDRLLILSPGAAFGSAKRWNEERFAALGDRLCRELGFRAAIIGSPSEQALCARISAQMSEPVTQLAGSTDLETLSGVLARADLVVTNDSGPMHMAAALGTPTLGIFGSTDAEVTGPVGSRSQVVRNPVDCSPCLLRECPIDHPCMEGLTVDQAFEAGRALLHASQGGTSLPKPTYG